MISREDICKAKGRLEQAEEARDSAGFHTMTGTEAREKALEARIFYNSTILEYLLALYG